MPLTKKGRKIMAAMRKQYGPEKGNRVFYASRNKGNIKGVDPNPGIAKMMDHNPGNNVKTRMQKMHKEAYTDEDMKDRKRKIAGMKVANTKKKARTY